LAINSAASDAIKSELEQIFVQQSLAYWTQHFENADCCVTPVLRLDEALKHPLFADRQMVHEAQHETEGHYWRLGSGIRFKD
jgi:crotonobetainyl-CoA:carnitine CoA-transferase CaiB-like acyl-CoA transferase